MGLDPQESFVEVHRFGSGRGGDTGGDVPVADPAASSRDIFFPLVVFKVFDGEGFILQVHGVFTRIRSGATRWLPAAARLDLHSPQRRQRALVMVFGTICWEWLQMRGVKNSKGFGFYL
jgi:hypothetical protein